ncbi:peptide ABC transporter permease [Microbacterium sp. SLBN-146]|uniref:peptide ABC transporter permease n=1 Tax=Microbacterium sp. SLBN-146 TaxID=2768457 RepID=UPI001152635E|nr:peptide ABC transporter permease [Microbacterium sp. SLBN-146]TQJ30103.1 hypothetical protein FBY39_0548 [Microbacterium sp. SLBN-146]
MTTLAAPPTRLSSRRVTWSTVDTGFRVASRAGEFIGSIDETADGRFVAFDGRSTPIGLFATLREAQRAVTGASSTVKEKAARLAAIAQPVAAASGIVAGVLLVGVGSWVA